MRHFNLVLLFTFFGLSVMQAQKTAVISKVTATWCPNCGTWGWGLAEELKANYAANDSEALFLGVHYSGNLENPTAEWFADNLKASSQPQFFVNNERASINSSNWTTNIENMKTSVSDYFNDDTSNSKLSFTTNRVIDWDGNFNLEIQVDAMEDSQNEHYLAVYVYENDVMDSQSGQPGQVMHPNVLREVISTEPFGDKYLNPGAGGRIATKVALTWPSNPEYVNDNLGFLAIMWEKVGDDYIMDYSISQNNWTAQLSNTDDVFSESINIKDAENYITITGENNGVYNVDIVNQQGQLISNYSFTEKLSIDKTEMPTGMYILSVDNKKERTTKKIFIK